VAQDSRPNKRVYRLTDDGRAALEAWVAQPTPGTRLRDEFFMKLVLAGRAALAGPRALIERQRGEYLQSLRDLDRLLAAANGDPTESLLTNPTDGPDLFTAPTWWWVVLMFPGALVFTTIASLLPARRAAAIAPAEALRYE
jgi:hypothetical protein